MTATRFFTTAALLAAFALLGCEDARIGGGPASDDDAGAGAEYAREFIFVAAEADAPASAVLGFTTLDEGDRLRRSAHAWAAAGNGWMPLYDLEWEGAPIRRAWRLVPHGPIRLRVGLDDEIEAIVVREADAVIARLATGDVRADWMPYHTSHVVLREATLELGDRTTAGWLVDARFGIAPAMAADPDADPANPEGVTPLTVDQPDDDGGIAGDGQADDAVSDDAADDGPPIGRDGEAGRVSGLRALLVTPDGATLVLGDTEAGIAGWFSSGDTDMVLPLVALTEAPGEPGSWLLVSDGATALAGRLESAGEATVAFAPHSVAGTIELDGTEMEVHGVLRPPGIGE